MSPMATIFLSLFAAVSVLGNSSPPPPAGEILDWIPDPNLTVPNFTAPYTSGYDIPLLAGAQNGTNNPEQIFLSPASKDGKYVYVNWITPKASGLGAVAYGTGKLNLKSTCKGTPYSYALGTNGAYTSGPIFHCALGPLAPSTTYSYQIGSKSAIYSFTTGPAVGTANPKKPLKIALIADVGQAANSSTTYDHMLKAGGFDLVVFPGDLNYADNYAEPCKPFNGTDLDFGTCAMGGLRWDSMFRLTQKVFSKYPVAFCPGNHELEFGQFWKQLVPYVAYSARVPALTDDYDGNSNDFPAKSPIFYSVKIGYAHIILLASYDPFVKYTHQWYWLQQELAQVNRTKTPWLIVSFHAPWYNSDKSHYREGESMRIMYEQWLYAAKVDLVIAGHVHAYERSVPVYDMRPNPCGPTYITVGNGGNDEGIAGPFLEPHPIYSAFREYSFGFSDLVIKDKKTAVFTWYRNQNTTLTVSDSITLTNKLVTCPK